jgi:hypothetical protein
MSEKDPNSFNDLKVGIGRIHTGGGTINREGEQKDDHQKLVDAQVKKKKYMDVGSSTFPNDVNRGEAEEVSGGNLTKVDFETGEVVEKTED